MTATRRSGSGPAREAGTDAHGCLSARIFGLVETVTAGGAFLIVAVSALLFGGVEPLHRGWIEAAGFGLLAVAALQPTLFRDRYLESRRYHTIGRRSLAPLLLAACALLSYGSLACLPVTAGLREFISPAWRSIAALSGDMTTGEPARRALSLNVEATREAVTLLAASLAVFFSSVVGLRRWRVVRLAALAFLSLVFCVSALALAQALSGGRGGIWSALAVERYLPPMGPFVNRNHFGAWASMGALVGMGYFFSMAGRHGEERGQRDLGARRAAVGFMTGLIVAAVAFSLSRGAMLGLWCGTALFGLLMNVKGKRRGAWGAAALLAAAAVAVSWAGAVPVWDRVSSLLQPAAAGGGVEVRLGMNRDLLRMAADFPWTGSGPGTFNDVYPLYQTTDPAVHYSFAHNDYLQFLAEWGSLGAVILLIGAWLVWLKFARRFRVRRNGEVIPLAAGAASAVFAVMVHSLVDFSLHVPAVGLAFLFVAALMLAAAGARASGDHEEG